MKKLFLPLLITFFIVAGCLDESAPPEQNFAIGIVHAEFIEIDESETSQPIANTEMNLYVNVEGENENIPVAQQILSDENGIVETDIAAGEELTITNIIFEFVLNDEVQTVEEQVSLELTFEEPYDDVSLVFEVETGSDDNGNGDENGNGGND